MRIESSALIKVEDEHGYLFAVGTPSLVLLIVAISVPNARFRVVYLIFHTATTVIGWVLQSAWLWIALGCERRATLKLRHFRALEMVHYNIFVVAFSVFIAFLLAVDTVFPYAAKAIAENADFGHLHSIIEGILIAIFVSTLVQMQRILTGLENDTELA